MIGSIWINCRVGMSRLSIQTVSYYLCFVRTLSNTRFPESDCVIHQFGFHTPERAVETISRAFFLQYL
jgi:hypothetical protein